MAGLNKNRKPVAGLTTKNCQLISGRGKDDITVRQLETIFVGQNIQTIESNEIAYDGGILNCITWNIKTDK